MLDPRTLPGRLTYAYSAALVLALVTFACASLALFDRFQQQQLDRQLQAAANALAAKAAHEGHSSKPEIEHEDAARIAGLGLSAAVVSAAGSSHVETAPLPPPVRQAVLASGAGAAPQTVESAGGRLRVALTPISLGAGAPGTAVVWRKLEEDEALDAQIRLSFALVIPLVTVLAVLGGALVARRGLEPLQRIARVASEIEATDLSRRLGFRSYGDELGALAAAFDRMLDRLQQAFERERRFTSDASHELRAPLSVIRATADYALSQQRDPAEYRRALQTIAVQSEELGAVVGDLLAAARAQEPRASAGQRADVAAVAFDVAEELFPLARRRSVAIRRALAEDSCAAIDPSDLARSLRAILDNAIAHAREGGWVELTVCRNDGTIDVTVCDDGPGFSPQGLRHATERFWRDDPARQRGEGSGLGLAIARGIVESAGGTLALRNAAGGGAEVVVRLATATA
jgi:signal transduction histidine kinase